jgi:nucleotide-binding universal stress UspA family protein
VDSRLRTAGAWPSAPGFDWERQHFKDANDSVSGMLESVSRRFRKMGHAVETHILDGDPKQAIIRQAAKLDVDTLFVGAGGNRRHPRMFLGSVASAVAVRARCSVEVLRSAQ